MKFAVRSSSQRAGVEGERSNHSLTSLCENSVGRGSQAPIGDCHDFAPLWNQRLRNAQAGAKLADCHQGTVFTQTLTHVALLRRALRQGLGLTAVLAIGLSGAGCEQPQPIETEPVVRAVRYVRAEPQGGVRVRTFSGAAKAGVEAQISFKVGGTLEQLNAEVGDFIREGDLIAVLDPVDYELQVEQTRASREQSEAMAVKAQADFERIRGLYERDNASRADYDAARAAADSAWAQVRASDKQLEQAERSLAYCKLRSPTDGDVAETPAEVNENVSAGQPIVRLNARTVAEVAVSIPEVLIGDIRKGMAVQEIRFDALPGRRFSGVVSEMAPTATQGLTTYPVTIRLPRNYSEILPGMAADVSFSFATNEKGDRFVLPTEAVGEDANGVRYVFVVKPSGEQLGLVEKREVGVGDLVSGGLEIFSGVRPGELVVTAGVSQIREGMEVRLGGPRQG